MALSDRLKRIAAHYNLTVRDFERRANLANGYVRTIGNSMGANKVESILTAFPDVSRVWLLTGEGNMLKSSEGGEEASNVVEAPKEPEAPAAAEPLASRLLALVESQQQIIAELTENNSRLTRLVEGYKKVSTPAAEVGAPLNVD